MIESSLFRFHEISDTRGPGDNSLVPEGAFGQKPFESSFSCPAPAPAVSVPRTYPGKGRGGGGTGGGVHGQGLKQSIISKLFASFL